MQYLRTGTSEYFSGLLRTGLPLTSAFLETSRDMGCSCHPIYLPGYHRLVVSTSVQDSDSKDTAHREAKSPTFPAEPELRGLSRYGTSLTAVAVGDQLTPQPRRQVSYRPVGGPSCQHLAEILTSPELRRQG